MMDGAKHWDWKNKEWAVAAAGFGVTGEAGRSSFELEFQRPTPTEVVDSAHAFHMSQSWEAVGVRGRVCCFLIANWLKKCTITWCFIHCYFMLQGRCKTDENKKCCASISSSLWESKDWKVSAEESGNEKLKRKKWLNMSRSERGKKKGKQKKRRLTGKQNPERGNSFNDLHVEKAGNESGGS